MKMMEEGLIEPLDEEIEMAMYDRLSERLAQAGYEHYEVSNYALQGYRSRHNSSYWHDIPYVGLGAAAHSYDGHIRRWNIADLDRYMAQTKEAVRTGVLPYEFERLTDAEQYNERVMLSLRTIEGIEEEMVRDRVVIDGYIAEGMLVSENGRIRATQKGLHILNRIIEDIIIG